MKSVNLSEGEQLSIRGADERGALLVLANHTLLVEGQVIRSPTNTMSVYYRSTPEGSMGVFQLHYQSEYDVYKRTKPVHQRLKYILTHYIYIQNINFHSLASGDVCPHFNR